MKLRRIFVLVPDCHVRSWRYAKVWERHFYEGLEQAGVAVIRPQDLDFAWARPPQTHDPDGAVALRTRTSEKLLEQIFGADGGAPQAVLSCCFSHDLDLDVVDRVRAKGIPWINFFCDSLYAFDLVAGLAARTSLNWFVESEAKERYRSLGVPFLRAPYAVNPNALPDASCITSEHSLLFVGSANRNRLRTATILRIMGVDLQVRGWGWPEALAAAPHRVAKEPNLARRMARGIVRSFLATRIGDYLDDETLLTELRQSAVVLGLNQGGAEPNACSYLKLRDLEFPGMGCCYLTQYHRDLAEIFELGKDILTFRSAWEASRLAKDLARHPAECRAIGHRARARILGEHTWSARLAQLEAHL
ncbi:MAG: glycosyltransferase [Nibricoccus sp.]